MATRGRFTRLGGDQLRADHRMAGLALDTVRFNLVWPKDRRGGEYRGKRQFFKAALDHHSQIVRTGAKPGTRVNNCVRVSNPIIRRGRRQAF